MKSLGPLLVGPLFVFGLTLANATAAEPERAADPAISESPSAMAALERGRQLLAQKQYDEAIEAFEAALEQRPTAETQIGLATAKLRGRKVLQPGDMCDPARFRAELKAHHRVEEMIFNIRFLDPRYFEPDPVESRQREIAEAIELFEAAAKAEPANVSIHEQIASTEIALSQFDEEARLRSTMGDIDFATESDFGNFTRREAFELPSLRLWSGVMYRFGAGGDRGI